MTGLLTGYALLLRMPRKTPLLIVVFAALLLVEPLIHSHPLWENSDARTAAANSTCAVCASTTAQLPTTAPHVVAPQTVVGTLAAAPIAAVVAVVPLTRSSRAPPAA